MRFLLLSLTILWSFSIVTADILVVPTQHETIHEGIEAASDSGDIVLVMPGEYRENIDFDGKQVLIYGIGGPQVTILDGGGEGPCVSFTSAEGLGSIITGFTMTNGSGENDRGGAIVVAGQGIQPATPVIAMNIITGNGAGSGGAVYSSNLGAPMLYRNLFLRNSADGQGGAINVGAGGSAIVMNNTFVGNESGSDGAVLYFNFLGVLVQFTNNIVVHNESGGGGAVFAPRLGAARVSAGYNDVWENEGGNYGNVAPGEGAISEDPLFINEENDIYYLLEDSPCIDMGDPNGLSDFDGSRADIGCYSSLQGPDMETVVAEPDSVDFGTVEIGNDSSITISLINPNEDEITAGLLSIILSTFSFSDTVVTLEGDEEVDLEITFAPDEEGEISDSVMIVTTTRIELADTLVIPYPIGITWLRLAGTGEEPSAIEGKHLEPVDYKLLSCYPNPFNSSLEVEVKLNRAGEISLEVFDIDGRQVSVIYRGYLSSGENRFNWSPAEISTGTYFIKLTHSTGTVEMPVKYMK